MPAIIVVFCPNIISCTRYLELAECSNCTDGTDETAQSLDLLQKMASDNSLVSFSEILRVFKVKYNKFQDNSANTFLCHPRPRWTSPGVPALRPVKRAEPLQAQPAPAVFPAAKKGKNMKNTLSHKKEATENIIVLEFVSQLCKQIWEKKTEKKHENVLHFHRFQARGCCDTGAVLLSYEGTLQAGTRPYHGFRSHFGG